MLLRGGSAGHTREYASRGSRLSAAGAPPYPTPRPRWPGLLRTVLALFRTRGLGNVIPDPHDQKSHRERIGSSSGRPVTFDRTADRGRNGVERTLNGFKRWRGLATRETTRTPTSIVAASSSRPCCSG